VVRDARHRFDNAVKHRDDAHPAQVQLTPAYILEPVRMALGGFIELDPCTTPDNPCGAQDFYTPPQDGSLEPWDAGTIYVNPPYSAARNKWVRKCVDAGLNGSIVILLMPAATDTETFQLAATWAEAVLFIKGRVRFGVPRPDGTHEMAASHPSALFGWNTDLAPCKHLGLVMRP
jgi:DNA N-6-adenine-methyltransferase (Dam)